MSEFKITGDLFVSEWNGASINPGTDISPYVHPADAISSTTNIIVVGTGYYFGVWTGYRRLWGDGKVIIDCNGGHMSGGAGNTVINPTHKNVKIIRCSNLFGLGTGQDAALDSCFLEFDTVSTGYRVGGIFLKCIFKAYTVEEITRPLLSGSDNTFNLSNCIFLSNVYLPHQRFGGTYDCCYLPKGVRLRLSSNLTTWQNHLNCLYNGFLQYLGVDYELKKLHDGSPRPDADPLIPDFVDVFPTIYSQGNFAGEAKIIDVENKIAEPDSALFRRSNSYGSIGGFFPGKYIQKDDSDPNVEITTSQIDTSDPSNWTIGSGYDEGYIYITFKLSDNLVQVPKINPDTLFAFDASEVGGSIGNNNAPDYFPTLYTPLSQVGLKPNRLTYGLRTSIRTDKPTSESHWDNDNLAISTDIARYYVQEWSTQPKIANVLGVTYGTGNPESIGAIQNSINARWCQVAIRLTNKRTI